MDGKRDDDLDSFDEDFGEEEMKDEDGEEEELDILGEGEAAPAHNKGWVQFNKGLSGGEEARNR